MTARLSRHQERHSEQMISRWDRQQKDRANALARLQRLTALGLSVTAPIMYEPTRRQVRADLITLGCSPAELDAAGIRA